MDRPAVNFRDIADDSETKARTGLAGGVEPRAALEQFAPLFLGDTRPVVLDQDIDHAAFRFDGDEYAAAAIFGGILHEVAEHFVEVLALDAHLRLMIARDVDGDSLMQPVDRALDGLEAFPHRRSRLRRRASADGASPREMVIDLAAHH